MMNMPRRSDRLNRHLLNMGMLSRAEYAATLTCLCDSIGEVDPWCCAASECIHTGADDGIVVEEHDVHHVTCWTAPCGTVTYLEG